MATKKTEISLERNEFHQVQVTYSLKVNLGDQKAWDQLLAMAFESGNVVKDEFPAKAPKKPEQWQDLYMRAGEQVKEVARRLPDQWWSEINGDAEISVSVRDEDDNEVCESISPEF